MEIKEEGTRHMLILFNCRKDMAGSVDFSAANAKSSAQLRVKGDFFFLTDDTVHVHWSLVKQHLGDEVINMF